MKIQRVVTVTNMYVTESEPYRLRVDYQDNHEFVVTVTHIPSGAVKSKTFRASFEPLFGMDVVDHENALAIAEALCEDFDAELPKITDNSE